MVLQGINTLCCLSAKINRMQMRTQVSMHCGTPNGTSWAEVMSISEKIKPVVSCYRVALV